MPRYPFFKVFACAGAIFFLSGHGVSGDTELHKVDPLSQEQKRQLIQIAKESIAAYVNQGQVKEFAMADPRLQIPEGAFVTIKKRKELRGCIGRIVSQDPLYQTVRDMAIAAATKDPRFPAVSPKELAELVIEVSVLSQPWEIKDVNEIELGKHGVIVSQGYRSGVFLPQVATDTGWTREEFLSQLCEQKAGLPPDAWKDPRTKIEIFTADVFSEETVH